MKTKPTNNIRTPSKVLLSLVVPVFNEEKRIDNITIIDNYLHNRLPHLCELIVVNDGSTDKTLKILKGLTLKTPLRIISYKTNKGKGYAIKTGMQKAKGDIHMFLDIDLSTPPNHIPKFLRKIGSGYDVVIGSRKIKGAKVTESQSALRENLGKAFTSLSRVILEVPVSDFTCGFKMFNKNASKQIFSLQRLERWGFDSEILFITGKIGLRLIEVPVKWKNSSLTKVKFPQDLIGSFLELLKVRINYYKGLYEKD